MGVSGEAERYLIFFFVLFWFELLMMMGLLSMIELSCLHSAGHGICS